MPRPPKPEAEKLDDKTVFRHRREEKTAWQRAADAAGKTLSDWLRWAANKAARGK